MSLDTAIDRRTFVGGIAAMAGLPRWLLGRGAAAEQSQSLVEFLRSDPAVVLQRVCEDFLNSLSSLPATSPWAKVNELVSRHWERIEDLLRRQPLMQGVENAGELFSDCASDDERWKRKIGRVQAGLLETLKFDPFMHDVMAALPPARRDALNRHIMRNVEQALSAVGTPDEHWQACLERLETTESEMDPATKDFISYSFALERAAAPYASWAAGVAGPAIQRSIARLTSCYLLPDESYLTAVQTLCRRWMACEDPLQVVKEFSDPPAARMREFSEQRRQNLGILARLDAIEKRLWAGEGFRPVAPGERRFYDTYGPSRGTLSYQVKLLTDLLAAQDQGQGRIPG